MNKVFDVSALYVTERSLAQHAFQTYEIEGQVHARVDIVTDGDGQSFLAELAELGLSHGSASGNVVSGFAPLCMLQGLSQAPGFVSLTPSVVRTSVGLVTSQDVSALNVDLTRERLDVDGTGITIGILSDSFAQANPDSELAQALLPQYTRFADDVASGDLPPDVVILEDAPAELADEVLDEGRALAQLVHDIAPGADILFHTAFNGVAGFANGIQALVDAGADIIVDDVIYLSEPMFQDGIVAQAASSAVRQGVAYFSSAGNNGAAGYQAEFRESSFSLFGSTLHDWDPSPRHDDPLLEFTLQPGQSIDTVFQWSEPYASAPDDTGAGPIGGSRGSASDLDFLLVDENFKLVAASAFDNLDGDPFESIRFTNQGATAQEYSLLAANIAGESPDLIRFVDFANLDFVLDTDVEHPEEFRAPTTYGHSVAEGVIGVAAAPWFLTSKFNDVGRAVPAFFTSLGGSRILFDENGVRLPTPDVRDPDAVDITATDGGNTTFFTQDTTRDDDHFPNFFGTSAAAANAAGVAALLLDKASLTPAEIEGILEDTAVDIRTPYKGSYLGTIDPTLLELASIGVGRGDDPRTGAGLIDSFAALERLDRQHEVAGRGVGGSGDEISGETSDTAGDRGRSATLTSGFDGPLSRAWINHSGWDELVG